MKKYIIGNWKLNPATLSDATTLASSLKAQHNSMVGVVPSLVHAHAIKSTLAEGIMMGVQDIAHQTDTTGAFTGDVSAHQVADVGATFVLVGHSERRQYHGEDDKILIQKIINAHLADLMVVFCIGESLNEYRSGLALSVLDHQLSVLHRIDKTKLHADKLIIAYEPVWAIGTGLTPTTDEIISIHQHIKHHLNTQYGVDLPVLYGGSVNDKNAHDIANCQSVDGVLVGGASLKIDSFSTIIQAFSQI